MIEIKEYEPQYSKQISDIVIRNLLEININDYEIEKVKEMAKDFEVKKLNKTLINREKVYVALKDNEVVGTAGVYTKQLPIKKLVVPASITAHEFYYKLGYRYKDGRKELNEENMYIMEKYIRI